MGSIRDDLRAAVRSLRRAPGFCVAAAGTLALGIAINAAMFSILYAVFFRLPPYPTARQLFNWSIHSSTGAVTNSPTFADADQALARLGEIAAYVESTFVVSAGLGGQPEAMDGVEADTKLFSALGLSPQLGRGFTEDDAKAGAAPVVIIGDMIWRRRLGGSADVLGKTIRIDGIDRTIVGVMPPNFEFPFLARFYVPLNDRNSRKASLEASALVRLNDPQRAAQARQVLESLVRRNDANADVWFGSMQEPADAIVTAILAAIGFVLLIACSNVANLMLARGTSRREELALRAALGASRGTLIRYLTMEGVVLALIGVTAGTIASLWLVELLVATLPVDQVPGWFNARPDARVLGYIALLGLVSVLVSGVLPAFNVTRNTLWSSLSSGGARNVGDLRTGRLRSSLVGVQIALALMLLIATGLMIRAFSASRAFDPGYPAASVLELRTQRPTSKVQPSFATDAITQLEAVPGVAAAGALADADLSGIITGSQNAIGVVTEAQSPHALRGLGLPLLRGRAFNERGDERGTVVLSQTAAIRVFGTLDAAVGKSFRFRNDSTREPFTVIGVVADRGLPGRGGSSRLPYAYVPLGYGDLQSMRLVARAERGDPTAFSRMAVSALRTLDRDLVVQPARTMLAVERDRFRTMSWFASLFAGFGITAVLLAALGIYGVVAYSVSRRTREIGVRIALGATRSHILRHVVGGVMPPTLWGLGFGLAGAVALGLLLRDTLFGIPPADPVSLAAGLIFFLAIALAAALLPARRAARLDPVLALGS
jgi:putative ABC transport system permease protein